MKHGGKLLGEGGYGCVFDSHFNCKNETSQHKFGVRKVFKYKHDSLNEFNEMKIINELDPKSKFSNPAV